MSRDRAIAADRLAPTNPIGHYALRLDADEELMRWGLVAAGTIWGVLIFVFRDKLTSYLDRTSPDWPPWLRRNFPLIMTGVMAVWVVSLAATGWGVY